MPAQAVDTLSAVHAFPTTWVYSKSFLEYVRKVNVAGKGIVEIKVRGGPEAILRFRARTCCARLLEFQLPGMGSAEVLTGARRNVAVRRAVRVCSSERLDFLHDHSGGMDVRAILPKSLLASTAVF